MARSNVATPELRASLEKVLRDWIHEVYRAVDAVKFARDFFLDLPTFNEAPFRQCQDSNHPTSPTSPTGPSPATLAQTMQSQSAPRDDEWDRLSDDMDRPLMPIFTLPKELPIIPQSMPKPTQAETSTTEQRRPDQVSPSIVVKENNSK